MHQAIECARTGATSANKAAELYGIPKSTLKDRLSGCVQPGSTGVSLQCARGPLVYT